MITNVVCHTDIKYLTMHVYLYLTCSTAIWKGSLFREQNKLRNILFNLLLYQSHVRLCLKHFSSVYVYSLRGCLLCFCHVTGFPPFTCTSQREQELERAGHCACEQLRPGRTSEGGRGDFQEYKWHLVTWAGAGTQVNACLPAVLLNVSPVKSQMTLDSFFPVFIFRLASHPRGNVRTISFPFLLLSKAS